MIIGIDLGTTNSLVAYWDTDEVKIIPNALGKLLTPSVISMDNDTVLIGEPALNRLVSHPTLTVANFKRYIGTDKIFKLGNYSFRAEELSALILKQLKEDAENYLGKPISEAIISVPAYFSDTQRKATKLAGKLAGLKVERLINEPTAAGIAYGLQEEADETNYLIFDLGGGTFDVSVLSIFSDIIEVCASCGDNLLGGIDFTGLIQEMFLNEMKKTKNIAINDLPLILQQKIHEQAELAKFTLSAKSEASIKIKWNEDTLEYTFTEEEFGVFVEPLLQRLREPVKKVLSDAKLSSSQIQKIILVGGATKMMIIRRMVGRMFGKLPLYYLDPDTVVVQGVAIQAGLKAQDSALDDIVVTDVCPYSLGVAVCSYNSSSNSNILHFDPLIERNTTIPTSRSKIYYPMQINQSKIDIKIYQGEHFFIEKNIFLGDLAVDLPAGLKDPAIDIRFTYDINGLLEIEATIIETQEKKKLIIEGNPGALNEQEIEQKLEALRLLKIHPRDKIENILALSQAEKLYTDLQGEKRVQLSNIIKEFVKILDEQNEIKIKRAREELQKTVEHLKIEFSCI